VSGLRPTLLHPVFWPEVRRGGERTVRLLADGLLAAGDAPRLVTSGPARLPSRCVEDGLSVVRLPRVGTRHLWRTVGDPHAAHHALALPLLTADPGDVLHALYPTDAALAVRATAARRRLGRGDVPVVISVLGPPDRAWAVARRGRLEGLVDAARGAAAVTALSAFAAERLWRGFGVRAEVVPPPVDLDAFVPDARVERAARPTVLFASDASDGAKRLGLLLRALPAVRRSRPGTTLLVNRPRDPALAGRLRTTDGVELRDLDDPAALLDAYRRAWTTVLPSRDEAFGLVVAESLACGTPAVALAAEGPAEVIADDAVGRIASAPTPNALAAAVLGALELAGDPGTPAACRAAVGHLGVAAHAARIAALYRRATER
jgi:glycosyltransferase involved in cell wall biosynthesis